MSRSMRSFVLAPKTRVLTGLDARRDNILAAKLIADVLASTLGPGGLDKLVIDVTGDTWVTSDGAHILRYSNVQHPAARVMVDAARHMDYEMGDGTTSLVVLTGELLGKAFDLLNEKIHPVIIVAGFTKAAEAAVKTLDRIAVETSDPFRSGFARKVALTAIGNRVSKEAAEHLASLACDAAAAVARRSGGRPFVDKNMIRVYEGKGESILDTRLIRGLIVDRELISPSMPKCVKPARIALLKCALEFKKPKMKLDVRVKRPEDVSAFINEERRLLTRIVDKLDEVGANVVFSQYVGVNSFVKAEFAKRGIIATDRVKFSDIERLERATGARVVANVEDITEKDLGYAERAEVERVNIPNNVGDYPWITVDGCKNPLSLCILIRAGTDKVVDEVERVFADAVSSIANLVRENRIVAGGGAVEMEVSKRLKRKAKFIAGKEQLAYSAFADALEAIPRTLIANKGHKPHDLMPELRRAHSGKGRWVGVDVSAARVTDMMKRGIVEPSIMKKYIVRSAAETASMVVRIDEVISAVRRPREMEASLPNKETGRYGDEE
ncbi:MAG: thermosome subunit beta [Candidatus Bathyarchaeia archaeon]